MEAADSSKLTDAQKKIIAVENLSADAVEQYKTIGSDGSYEETNFNIAQTITDAVATLSTASNWGQYEISITETSTKNLRNDRNTGWPVGENIQGIILETTDEYKVGLEYLQNIWVQPYKFAFNVDENGSSTGIAKVDNLIELAKLVGKTVNKITYITPLNSYIYSFENGIYIKPAYTQTVKGSFVEDMSSFILNNLPEVTNGTMDVVYTVGSGRTAVKYSLYSGALEKEVTLDLSVMDGAESGGVYSASISSDDYADISVAIPMTASQKTDLEALAERAGTLLLVEAADNGTFAAHKAEADELLASSEPTTAEAAELISELKELMKGYIISIIVDGKEVLFETVSANTVINDDGSVNISNTAVFPDGSDAYLVTVTTGDDASETILAGNTTLSNWVGEWENWQNYIFPNDEYSESYPYLDEVWALAYDGYISAFEAAGMGDVIKTLSRYRLIKELLVCDDKYNKR